MPKCLSTDSAKSCPLSALVLATLFARQEEEQEPQYKYKVVHGNEVKNINQDGRQVR